ncbi:unnamed protein product, partial [Brenthis ino]
MLTVQLSSSTSQLRSASRGRACPVDDLSSPSKARRLMPAILPIKKYLFNCLGGVMASMYGCISGGPGFESRVGPSLVIESICIVSLSNSPELGSWRCFTPVPRRARKAVGPAP